MIYQLIRKADNGVLVEVQVPEGSREEDIAHILSAYEEASNPEYAWQVKVE